ncbi:hypothetical protein BD779DRAFT_1412368, partial [Infundibulicybe gibba]
TEDPFPAISFKVMNNFVTANFSSKISLATVLMVLFTLTDNPDLLNLHARQKHPVHRGEQRTSTSGWIRSLARGVQSQLGTKTQALFTSSEHYGDLEDDECITAIALKLDAFAEVLGLTPYNDKGKFQAKLQPVSYQNIQSVRTICPSSFTCQVKACESRGLLQATRPRDIPIVTLIKGSTIYQSVYVLSGKCSKCDSIYYADHQRAKGSRGFVKTYLNSAQYLKIGQTTWVDRIFSNAVISGIYSFHASAAAYTEYWNHSFGDMDSQSRAWVTRRQIWQAFVQESIRSIGSVSKINLELGDQLSIDEVTLEAFSILGQKGQIRPAHGHECAECTQPYKAQSEFIAQQDPAATVEDEIQHVPVLKSGSSILAESPEDNMDVDADMDVDYAAVKMVTWIILVVVHFVHTIIFTMVHAVVCMAAKAKESIQLRHNYFGPSRFYCVETICAPCGVVIAWTKFDKAESPTNILQFLEDVYPTEESRPAYICIDKACLVLRTSIANKSWEMWSRTSRFIVDSYHYINHRATDYLCRKWCNPAPLDGSAPNLVVVATDNNGKPYYQRAFNTQASEQLNSWVGGFESILRRMTPGNFNWFLHV